MSGLGGGIGIGVEVGTGIDQDFSVNPGDCRQVAPSADTDGDPDSDPDIEGAFCPTAQTKGATS